jgi:hypothetical protein
MALGVSLGGLQGVATGPVQIDYPDNAFSGRSRDVAINAGKALETRI